MKRKVLQYNSTLIKRAKELRKAGNLAEALLWIELKKMKTEEICFVRQKAIGNYIADFYCANKKLIIEIDGASHESKGNYDEQRDAYFQGLGLKVVHILDSDVRKQLENVMGFIRQFL